MPPLDEIVAYLDELLNTAETPDYAPALNGLQLANAGDVRKIGAAVDFSRRAIDSAVTAGANLLIVHHGMFWGGLQPVRGAAYERLKALIAHDGSWLLYMTGCRPQAGQPGRATPSALVSRARSGFPRRRIHIREAKRREGTTGGAPSRIGTARSPTRRRPCLRTR